MYTARQTKVYKQGRTERGTKKTMSAVSGTTKSVIISKDHDDRSELDEDAYQNEYNVSSSRRIFSIYSREKSTSNLPRFINSRSVSRIG